MFKLQSPPARLRRLAGVGALVVMTLTACRSEPPTETPRKLARVVDAAFDTVAAAELQRDPETVTRLGIPAAPDSDAAGRLTNRSQAAFERGRLDRIETLQRLDTIPAPPEASARARHLNTIRDAYDALDVISAFGRGQVLRGEIRPYVIDHRSGAYINVPELITLRQSVTDDASAKDYIRRLLALPEALDDERLRLLSDAHSGNVPPRIILEKMEAQAAALGTVPGDGHPLITLFDALLAGAVDLSPQERVRMRARASQIVSDDILPAYTRLRATIAALKVDAEDEPGLWAQAQGRTYYSAVLNFYIHDPRSPDQLHADGKAAVASLSAALNTALAEQDYIDGALGVRLALLAALPDQRFVDTEEGRAALIARLSNLQEDAKSNVSRLFARAPDDTALMAIVPAMIREARPLYAYEASTLDGRAPALVYLNLGDPDDWPAYTLPTRIHALTFPGRHTEDKIASQFGDMPLTRSLFPNHAYSAGWSIYAEELADEAGLFEADPLGRIGYLQSLLLSAALSVVDTGIHTQQWSREESIDYLLRETGLTLGRSETEVDAVIVEPARAAAAWAAREQIWLLRSEAEQALGTGFDLAAFHHLILSGGPRPLGIVRDDVQRWSAAQQPD